MRGRHELGVCSRLGLGHLGSERLRLLRQCLVRLLACTAGPAERFREWEGCILRIDSGLGRERWPTTNSSRRVFGRGPTASGKRKDGRKVGPKRIGNRRGSSLLWKTPSTRCLNRSKRQKLSPLSSSEI